MILTNRANNGGIFFKECRVHRDVVKGFYSRFRSGGIVLRRVGGVVVVDGDGGRGGGGGGHELIDEALEIRAVEEEGITGGTDGSRDEEGVVGVHWVREFVSTGGIMARGGGIRRWGERVHLFKKVISAVRAKGRKGGGVGRRERGEEENTHVTFMAPVSLVVEDGGIVPTSGGGAAGSGGGGGGCRWGY